MAAYENIGGSPTGDAYLNGMLSGYKWAVDNLTYSFPTDASHYEAGYGSEPTNNFGVLNGVMQAAVTKILGMYSSVANIGFTLMTETSSEHADMRFAMSDSPGTAWAYLPSSSYQGGDSWYNNSSGNYSNPVIGNYAYQTILHEIGHALGLEHPHEADHDTDTMPSERDGMEWTVMSYKSYAGAEFGGYLNETWGYAQTLMALDIAAMQYMYGANFSTYSGSTTYTWNPNTGEMSIDGVGQGTPGANRIFQTVWDGGGEDTYDFSSYSANLTVNLRPGEWTTTSADQLAQVSWDGRKAVGNIANALLYNGDLRSLIENAVGGSGNDVITGNQANNVLSGGAGKDTLTGGAGNDTLNGGNGNDRAIFSGARLDYSITLLGNGSFEVVDLRGGSPDGTDTLSSIEWLEFSDRTYTADEFGGNGPEPETPPPPPPPPPTDPVDPTDPTYPTYPPTPVVIFGTAGNDLIAPNSWNAGHRPTEAGDTISAGAGNDTIDGWGGNDLIEAGAGKDVIFGGGGDDVIRIWGSEGIGDTIRGGEIDEVFGDTIELSSKVTLNGFNASASEIENLNGRGYAIVGTSSSDTFDFRGLTSVSRLSYVDGGKGNDKLYGSAFAEDLRGGDGNDYLNGGHGNDTLTGGKGNDKFVFAKDSTRKAVDRITDFGDAKGNEDIIDVSAVYRIKASGFEAWKKKYVKQVGKDAQILLGDDKIVLTKVSVKNLDFKDFDFVL